MDSKKSRSRRTRMTNGHGASSGVMINSNDAEGTSELQKAISEISQVPDSAPSANFRKIKGPGKGEMEAAKNRRIVRQPRNLRLVESSDSDNDTKCNDFLEDWELMAEMRSMVGGANNSNRALENNWHRGVENSNAARSSYAAEEPRGFNETKSRRDKLAKNVCIMSLLKQQEETMKNVGEQQACNGNFVRDPVDTDFYYRRTNVSNDEIDFTVEHVGKITIVGPKKFIIENTNDDDFTFVRREKQPSEKSQRKKDH